MYNSENKKKIGIEIFVENILRYRSMLKFLFTNYKMLQVSPTEEFGVKDACWLQYSVLSG